MCPLPPYKITGVRESESNALNALEPSSDTYPKTQPSTGDPTSIILSLISPFLSWFFFSLCFPSFCLCWLFCRKISKKKKKNCSLFCFDFLVSEIDNNVLALAGYAWLLGKSRKREFGSFSLFLPFWKLILKNSTEINYMVLLGLAE